VVQAPLAVDSFFLLRLTKFITIFTYRLVPHYFVFQWPVDFLHFPGKTTEGSFPPGRN
jgi:hypothetical protein